LIYLEITPAAQAAVKSAAAAQKLETWWLRYELMPGGCTGFRHKLWLDAGPINRGEFEYRTPSVPFLLLESQRELVQGARIDYGTQNGQTGFIVTAPHASARTKAAIGQWLATDEKSHSRSGE
jgi:Fe-S cluster assembly iron-binding protein IscA